MVSTSEIHPCHLGSLLWSEVSHKTAIQPEIEVKSPRTCSHPTNVRLLFLRPVVFVGDLSCTSRENAGHTEAFKNKAAPLMTTSSFLTSSFCNVQVTAARTRLDVLGCQEWHVFFKKASLHFQCHLLYIFIIQNPNHDLVILHSSLNKNDFKRLNTNAIPRSCPVQWRFRLQTPLVALEKQCFLWRSHKS